MITNKFVPEGLRLPLLEYETQLQYDMVKIENLLREGYAGSPEAIDSLQSYLRSYKEKLVAETQYMLDYYKQHSKCFTQRFVAIAITRLYGNYLYYSTYLREYEFIAKEDFPNEFRTEISWADKQWIKITEFLCVAMLGE